MCGMSIRRISAKTEVEWGGVVEWDRGVAEGRSMAARLFAGLAVVILMFMVMRMGFWVSEEL